MHVGEIHRLVASHKPPAADLARNPSVCPDWESNWEPFGLQASTQSTEPHQPDLQFFILIKYTLVAFERAVYSMLKFSFLGICDII